jgi:hypothetical protein
MPRKTLRRKKSGARLFRVPLIWMCGPPTQSRLAVCAVESKRRKALESRRDGTMLDPTSIFLIQTHHFDGGSSWVALVDSANGAYSSCSAYPPACFYLQHTGEIAMAHIQLEEGVPGIRGPMAFRPETAKPMRELAEVLLRSPIRFRLESARRSQLTFPRRMIVTIARRFTAMPLLSTSTIMTLSWIRSNATTRKHRSQ